MLPQITPYLNLVEGLAAVATCIGIFIAVHQLRQTWSIAKTSFEDQLAHEYRDLVAGIPFDVLLGENIPDDMSPKERNEIYEKIFNYIDLSNEQIFLYNNNRINKATWKYWCEGIISNMSRVVFQKVWSNIKAKDKEIFSELRDLERKTDGFQSNTCP